MEQKGLEFSQEQKNPEFPPAISKSKEFESPLREDHNPLFIKFWQELQGGKGTEKGEVDVEELVEFYTNVETLNSLSKEEIFKIKECLRQFFRNRINQYNREYKSIINSEILLVETEYHFRLRELNPGGHGGTNYSLINVSVLSQNKKYKKVIESLKAKGIKALTLEEKIRFFNDPKFFKSTQYYNWNPEFLEAGITGFGSGSRQLTGEEEGGYYHSSEEFLEEAKKVRQQTGKSVLRALDVGGNFGFALKDMKDLDPNIETFNMTIDEYPSLFGDHIVRHPAEMMPKEFEETMDLINSQVAFRYFLYSDIALRNIIKALSVGGVAKIAYEIGRAHIASKDFDKFRLTEEEIKKRQKALWTGIKVLVDQGYLDIIESSPKIKEGILNPDENMRQGFVRFVKKKSTKGVQF